VNSSANGTHYFQLVTWTETIVQKRLLQQAISLQLANSWTRLMLRTMEVCTPVHSSWYLQIRLTSSTCPLHSMITLSVLRPITFRWVRVVLLTPWLWLIRFQAVICLMLGIRASTTWCLQEPSANSSWWTRIKALFNPTKRRQTTRFKGSSKRQQIPTFNSSPILISKWH